MNFLNRTIETATGYLNNHLLLHTVKEEKAKKFKLPIRLLLEIFGSFLMVFILMIPSSFQNEVVFFEYIISYNWALAFFISLITMIVFFISSKWGIASSTLSLSSQLYKGKIQYKRAALVWICQLLGAFAASFLIWSIMESMGSFIKTGEVVEGVKSLGTTLSSPIPFIKGWWNLNDGPGYKPETWLYATQAIVSFILIIIIVWMYRLSYQVNGKQTALWTATFKFTISFILIFLATHFSAHITSPTRIIANGLTAKWMGGCQNTTSAWILFFVVILGYQVSIMIPKNSRVNWKIWFKPEDYDEQKQKSLIDLKFKNKKTK